MSWNKHGIQIQLDTTTYCNAKCPMCHRTNPEGLDKVDWLPLIQWTFDDFKRAFSPVDLKLITSISFCPTWGDAMMSNHTYNMVEYIFEHNPLCRVAIDTNGSIRDETWWWEFGLLSKAGRYDLIINFDVDGTTQEMHSKYRQGTNLQKVLNNMKAYSETKSKAHVQTIIFKHNQPYLNDIANLVKEYGAIHHTGVYSDRFDRGQNNNTFNFIGADGTKQTLEKADMPIANKNYQEQVENFSSTINCSWQKQNRINISFDGHVHPCCYFGNPYDQKVPRFMNTPVIKEYIEDNKNLNIFNNSLSNIINHEWFKSKLADSWKSETPVLQCVRHCSSRIKMPDYFREYISITPV